MADHSDGQSSQQSQNRDPHNQGGLLAFVFAMCFVFAFFIYIVAIHPGIDLGENLKTPSATEVAAVDVSKIAEPWVPNPDMVAHGQKVFSQNCTSCHGEKGLGDGAAGQSLNPRPRNLVEGPWKKGGGFIGIYTVLLEGLPPSAMASYAHLSKVDRWSLVQFINSMTKAKVVEDPAKVAEFAKTAK